MHSALPKFSKTSSQPKVFCQSSKALCPRVKCWRPCWRISAVQLPKQHSQELLQRTHLASPGIPTIHHSAFASTRMGRRKLVFWTMRVGLLH